MGKTIGELSQKDIDAVMDSHDCRRRHAAVVNAYVAARAELQRWNAEPASKAP